MTPKDGANGAAPSPIDLASEPDFALGALRIQPSLASVSIGSDPAFPVEPRVLKVLILLVRNAGMVVSRDRLIASCWAGRIVGDDAINGCIAKIRRLAALTPAAEAFCIDTVPRVGYRLRLPAPAPACLPEPAAPPRAASRPRARRSAILLIAAAISIESALAIALILHVTTPPPARWSVTETGLLHADFRLQRHPAFSPDGSLLAYAAGDSVQTRQIYVVRPAGGPSLQLTHDGYDDYSPVWSADGRRIAYAAFRAGEPCRIFVQQFPLGAPVLAARCRSLERTHLAWSRAADAIFFLDRAGSGDPVRLMTLRFGDGAVSRLTHAPAGAGNEGEPSASPDGRFVAFERVIDDVHSGALLLDLRTHREYALGAPGTSFAWSADARTLFATNDADGFNRLLAIRLRDGRRIAPPETVLANNDFIDRPSFGGGLVAVESTASWASLARISAAGPSGTAPPRQMPPRPDGDGGVIPLEGTDLQPDIAPDGTIAVISDLANAPGLWIIPPAGPPHLLASVSDRRFVGNEPRFSPSGRAIAFVTREGGTPVLQVIATDGGQLAAIRFDGEEITPPAWLGTDDALIVPGYAHGAWNLYRADLAPHPALRKLDEAGWSYIRACGSDLYGVKASRPTVFLIGSLARNPRAANHAPPEGVTPRPILDLPADSLRDMWRCYGDTIIYADRGAAGPQLRARPIAGGDSHLLTTLPDTDAATPFAIDVRDGSIVIAPRRRVESHILMIHLHQTNGF